MSTKNKKIVYYLAAFLVVLMLVCTCLLGNTFARYVTGVSGTATANISKWNVDKEGGLVNNTSITFDTGNSLSPSASGNGSGVYYNSTTAEQVALITIDSSTEVDVGLTISATALAFYAEGASSAYTFTGSGISTSSPTAVSSDDVSKALILHVGYYSSTTNSAPTVTVDDNNGGGITALTEITIGGTQTTNVSFTAGTSSTTYVYIYAWVTWKTDYTTYSGTCSDGTYLADALDTWIGKNIATAQTTLTVQAIQTSDNP